jgi:hypothetical protein
MVVSYWCMCDFRRGVTKRLEPPHLGRIYRTVLEVDLPTNWRIVHPSNGWHRTVMENPLFSDER